MTPFSLEDPIVAPFGVVRYTVPSFKAPELEELHTNLHDALRTARTGRPGDEPRRTEVICSLFRVGLAWSRSTKVPIVVCQHVLAQEHPTPKS